MRVLLIGSGGREHALAWTLAASPLLSQLFVAPGNPGIAPLATLVPIGVEDIAALVQFARDNAIDLVFPGPEGPLVAGVADAMAAAGIACCGPSAAAAQLEGSKAFTKEIADAADIPTARWERFTDAAEARDFASRRGAPIVVKADGLAAGKGVVVAQTEAEADAAIDRFIPAGPVVIEECLSGPEVSLFALCDGTDAVFLGTARDHRVANGLGRAFIHSATCATGSVSTIIIHTTCANHSRIRLGVAVDENRPSSRQLFNAPFATFSASVAAAASSLPTFGDQGDSAP